MPTINKPKRKRTRNTSNDILQQLASQRIYQNAHYKGLRQIYIREHPICQCCANLLGRTTPATEVHHAIPFLSGNTPEEQLNLGTSSWNLVSLCDKCHAQVHQRKINITPRYKEGEFDYSFTERMKENDKIRI